MMQRNRRATHRLGTALASALAAGNAVGQQPATREPAEPVAEKPRPKILPRPAGGIARAFVDEKSMRELIAKLVAWGTRLTISSWTDAERGAGCGQGRIGERCNEMPRDSGGKLQVDQFTSTSARTAERARSNRPPASTPTGQYQTMRALALQI